MDTSKFEVGQKWRMRGGCVATIQKMMGNGKVCAYWDNETGGRHSVFLPNGRYHFHDSESEFDLICPMGSEEESVKLRYEHDQLTAKVEQLTDDLNDARNGLEAAAEELRQADVVRDQLVADLADARVMMKAQAGAFRRQDAREAKLVAALRQMRADAANNGHEYIVEQVDEALAAAGAV